MGSQGIVARSVRHQREPCRLMLALLGGLHLCRPGSSHQWLEGALEEGFGVSLTVPRPSSCFLLLRFPRFWVTLSLPGPRRWGTFFINRSSSSGPPFGCFQLKADIKTWSPPRSVEEPGWNPQDHPHTACMMGSDHPAYGSTKQKNLSVCFNLSRLGRHMYSSFCHHIHMSYCH